MNGHSDLICGTVACSAAFAQELSSTAMYVGGFLSAGSCMHLLKGLRTLSVRMRGHNENGRAFALAARDIAGVQQVYHGALCEPAGQPWITDFGGMLAIRFAAQVDAEKLIRSLRLVADVPSLGGTESTACLPWWTTNRWMPDEEKRRLKIDRQLIRFSIGLEDVTDLIADLKSALSAATRT
jgi:cystathionine beta-lyase/cystathionine gamma-synthase